MIAFYTAVNCLSWSIREWNSLLQCTGLKSSHPWFVIGTFWSILCKTQISMKFWTSEFVLLKGAVVLLKVHLTSSVGRMKIITLSTSCVKHHYLTWRILLDQSLVQLILLSHVFCWVHSLSPTHFLPPVINSPWCTCLYVSFVKFHQNLSNLHTLLHVICFKRRHSL